MSTATLTNNAQTVARIYDAFVRADIGYIMNHIAPDCQWTAAGAGLLPQGGLYTGNDVVSFFSRLGNVVEFTAFNPVTIINAGENEVVAYGNMSGISKATGKHSTSDWAMRWVFNEAGKVIFYQDFHDTAAAFLANQQ